MLLRAHPRKALPTAWEAAEGMGIHPLLDAGNLPHPASNDRRQEQAKTIAHFLPMLKLLIPMDAKRRTGTRARVSAGACAPATAADAQHTCMDGHGPTPCVNRHFTAFQGGFGSGFQGSFGSDGFGGVGGVDGGASCAPDGVAPLLARAGGMPRPGAVDGRRTPMAGLEGRGRAMGRAFPRGTRYMRRVAADLLWVMGARWPLVSLASPAGHGGVSGHWVLPPPGVQGSAAGPRFPGGGWPGSARP